MKSSTAPSRADPVAVFLFADGAHHKKPHSPTHPKYGGYAFETADWHIVSL